jgi:hypothetical protein
LQCLGALKNLLLSSLLTSERRALEIEKTPDLVSEVKPNADIISENSLEIEQTPLSQKLANSQQSYPDVEKQIIIASSSTAKDSEAMSKKIDYNMIQKKTQIGNLISELNQKYDQAFEKKLPAVDMYEQIEPIIRKLYRDRQNRQIIGSNNADALSRFLANISTDIDGISKAHDSGISSQEDELTRKVKVKVEELLQKLDDIYLSLNE